MRKRPHVYALNTIPAGLTFVVVLSYPSASGSTFATKLKNAWVLAASVPLASEFSLRKKDKESSVECNVNVSPVRVSPRRFGSMSRHEFIDSLQKEVFLMQVSLCKFAVQRESSVSPTLFLC